MSDYGIRPGEGPMDPQLATGAGQAVAPGGAGMGWTSRISPELVEGWADNFGKLLTDKFGGVGSYLALASLGYDLANIAGSDLNTRQKGAAGVRAGTDALTSYLGGAPLVMARKLGAGMQGSGSPQVRGAGRSLERLIEPAGISATFQGLAGSDMWGEEGAGGAALLDFSGPLGIALRGAGIGDDAVRAISFGMLGHRPTEGTGFRRGFEHMGSQSGFGNLNRQAYNQDEDHWNSMLESDRAAALALGPYLASFGGDGWEKNREAYGGQATNMLANSDIGRERGALTARAAEIFNGSDAGSLAALFKERGVEDPIAQQWVGHAGRWFT